MSKLILLMITLAWSPLSRAWICEDAARGPVFADVHGPMMGLPDIQKLFDLAGFQRLSGAAPLVALTGETASGKSYFLRRYLRALHEASHPFFYVGEVTNYLVSQRLVGPTLPTLPADAQLTYATNIPAMEILSRALPWPGTALRTGQEFMERSKALLPDGTIVVFDIPDNYFNARYDFTRRPLRRRPLPSLETLARMDDATLRRNLGNPPRGPVSFEPQRQLLHFMIELSELARSRNGAALTSLNSFLADHMRHHLDLMPFLDRMRVIKLD